MSASELLEDGSPSLFNDPLFSDLKIKFSGQTINCHKAISCKKSKYMLKAVTSPFKESHTGIIDLGDGDDPKCIETMLRLTYGLGFVRQKQKKRTKMTKGRKDTKEETNHIAFFVELFATSDKYDFPEVRAATTQLYKAEVKKKWFCEPAEVIAGFHSVLSQEWADKELFTATMVLCAKHVEDFRDEPTFKSLLDEISGLASKLLLDVFANMDDSDSDERTLRKCPECEHVDQATEEEVAGMQWTCAKCGSSVNDESPDWVTGRFWSRGLAGKTFLPPEMDDED